MHFALKRETACGARKSSVRATRQLSLVTCLVCLARVAQESAAGNVVVRQKRFLAR